jgi:hypothetical protein
MTISTAAWTEAELDDSILRLCLEFPDVRMVTCSRALEHCRLNTARGSRQTLLVEMRAQLQREVAALAA